MAEEKTDGDYTDVSIYKDNQFTQLDTILKQQKLTDGSTNVITYKVAADGFTAANEDSYINQKTDGDYTDVSIYKDNQLFSGTGAGNRNSYLLDMEGSVIHEWHTNYIPSLHEQLLQNGNLVRAQAPPATQPLEISTPLMLMKQPYTIGGGHGGLIQEFDWDGNLVWQYALNDATHVQHHTFTRNETTGNTLILGWEQKSYAEAVAKGRNPATVDKTRGLWPDYAIEVDHNTPANIVWEFHVWDNLIQNFDPRETEQSWYPHVLHRDSVVPYLEVFNISGLTKFFIEHPYLNKNFFFNCTCSKNENGSFSR